jgi:hypothetical protein
MSRPDDPSADSSQTSSESQSEWRKRRRLDAVFGDGLPETTSDERDDDAPTTAEDAGERWLRSQVPPHHG